MRDDLDFAKLPISPTLSEVNAYRQRAIERLKRSINLGDSTSLTESVNASSDFAIVRGRYVDPEPAEPAARVITKADLNDLMERMNYNSTDCGDLGTFVRLEHVGKFIEELKGKLDT